MLESLVSLVSIALGIIGANLIGLYKKEYSLGLIGNTITGVFGSILIIKSFGRLGFDPVSIMKTGSANFPLLFLNLALSLIAGGASVVLVKSLNAKTENMDKLNLDSISTFKIISFLEGMSYILLLFVAVPIKYMAGNSTMVKALGMPHGVLFILYILMALFIRSRMKWDIKTTLIVLVASLLPFGTFYINKKYL